jgi:hypothetical protein
MKRWPSSMVAGRLSLGIGLAEGSGHPGQGFKKQAPESKARWRMRLPGGIAARTAPSRELVVPADQEAPRPGSLGAKSARPISRGGHRRGCRRFQRQRRRKRRRRRWVRPGFRGCRGLRPCRRRRGHPAPLAPWGTPLPPSPPLPPMPPLAEAPSPALPPVPSQPFGPFQAAPPAPPVPPLPPRTSPPWEPLPPLPPTAGGLQQMPPSDPS